MINATEKQSANFDIASIDLLEMEDSLYADKHTLQARGSKYLIFSLDDKNYGILSGLVAEIFQPVSITKLFNAPQWLLGIAGFRNEVISVIDLKRLWNDTASPSSLKSRLIVLRSESNSSQIAFAVDKLSKIVTLHSKNIKPFKEEAFPNVTGVATYKSTSVYLLDEETLMSSIKFS